MPNISTFYNCGHSQCNSGIEKSQFSDTNLIVFVFYIDYKILSKKNYQNPRIVVV